jgi:hypothetical protein
LVPIGTVDLAYEVRVKHERVEFGFGACRGDVAAADDEGAAAITVPTAAAVVATAVIASIAAAAAFAGTAAATAVGASEATESTAAAAAAAAVAAVFPYAQCKEGLCLLIGFSTCLWLGWCGEVWSAIKAGKWG